MREVDDINFSEEFKKIAEFYIEHVKIPIIEFGFVSWYIPSKGLPLKITVRVEQMK